MLKRTLATLGTHAAKVSKEEYAEMARIGLLIELYKEHLTEADKIVQELHNLGIQAPWVSREIKDKSGKDRLFYLGARMRLEY